MILNRHETVTILLVILIMLNIFITINLNVKVKALDDALLEHHSGIVAEIKCESPAYARERIIMPNGSALCRSREFINCDTK